MHTVILDRTILLLKLVHRPT